jgi:hypothetical protein
VNSQYTLKALYPKDEDSMPVICQLIAEQKDERRLSPFLPLEEMVANYPPMPDARKDAMKNNSRKENRKKINQPTMLLYIY